VADASADSAKGNGDIVVTGSRIATGFHTPTPVTVATAADLRSAAPNNLADGLNQLPSFSGSTRTTQGGGANVSAGTNGQNLLSLRGLGPTRTLVLFDGHRIVPTNQNSSVDANVIPQNLISRVDVVTGGASAAYGSDAVAGVVNFVLDSRFTGLKANVQSGISTYGDLGSQDLSLAYGASLGSRLHLVANVEYFHQDGLGVEDHTGRSWYDNPIGQVPNPAGGHPTVVLVHNIRSSIGSNGGLISSGPLKGIQFLSGGVPAPFDYGTLTSGSFQEGGDGGNPANGLTPVQDRVNAFGHLEYDAGSHLTLWAEGLYSHSRSSVDAEYIPQVGAGGQFTIYRDNAYLPSSILTQMIADNVQSIPLGRYETEFGPIQIKYTTDVVQGTGGVRGDLSSRWKYDVTYSYGRSVQTGGQYNQPNLRRLYASADAVRNSSGQIVCRSTLSGYDPGCVPMDLFGQGSISPAAADWILGNSFKTLYLTQQDVSANLNGDFGDGLSLGAGPISFATGFEYRKESARQTADELSQSTLDLTGIRGAPSSLNNRLGVWQFANPQPLQGSYDVKEGYIEVGVPLFRDKWFADDLSLNGAVRHTIYSQSGGVTTWKAGGIWQFAHDFRLRITESQDIRGPNVLELFNAQTQTSQNVLYQGKTTQDTVIQSGNPNLRPEVAKTLTFGGIYQPSWIPGFQMSIDYYRIRIKDAIGQLSHQVIVDECAQGNQLACSQITVNSNGTLIVRSQGLNLNLVQTTGLDVDAAYGRNVGPGRLEFRVLANHLFNDFTTAPGSPPLSDLGAPGVWKWRGNASLRYTTDDWEVFAQERYLGPALNDPTKIEGIDVSYNHIPAQWYTDLTLAWNIKAFDRKQQFFVTVTNLFNRPPPLSPQNPTTYSVPVNFAYDITGRYIAVGFRIRL
jgi:outer membrane receptor protein involved in Fe transport